MIMHRVLHPPGAEQAVGALGALLGAQRGAVARLLPLQCGALGPEPKALQRCHAQTQQRPARTAPVLGEDRQQRRWHRRRLVHGVIQRLPVVPAPCKANGSGGCRLFAPDARCASGRALLAWVHVVGVILLPRLCFLRRARHGAKGAPSPSALKAQMIAISFRKEKVGG